MERTQLRGGLIVSCQLMAGEPLFGDAHIAALARARARAGAEGRMPWWLAERSPVPNGSLDNLSTRSRSFDHDQDCHPAAR